MCSHGIPVSKTHEKTNKDQLDRRRNMRTGHLCLGLLDSLRADRSRLASCGKCRSVACGRLA